MGAAFSAEGAAPAAPQRDSILPRLGNFAEASRDILQFVVYSRGPGGETSRYFLQFMPSAFSERNELQAENIQAFGISSFRREMSSAIEATETLGQRGML